MEADNADMNENSDSGRKQCSSTDTADGTENTSNHFYNSVSSVTVPLVTMQLHLA
jgi:hypothetical protein